MDGGSTAPRRAVEPKSGHRRLPLNPAPLIIVASPLLCYGLDSIVARCDEQSHLLCAEFEPELAALAYDTPTDPYTPIEPSVAPSTVSSTISPKVSWLNNLQPLDDAALLAALADFDISPFRRVMLLSLSGGFALHAAAYRRLQRILERRIHDYWQSRLTLTHNGRLWIRNLLRNIARTAACHDAAHLRSNLPIVVAAAGESLEASLMLIDRLRPRLCIVAVDTALPALHAANIEPDLVVALDAQQTNLSDFLGQQLISCRLACDLTVCPTIVRCAPSQSTYVFVSQFAQTSLLDSLAEKDLLPLSPAATRLGRHSGCPPRATNDQRPSSHNRPRPQLPHRQDPCARHAL